MFRLAIRDILRQRARTLLTLAAIALGVASMLLSGGFVEDILLQLRESTIHSQLGHLQIYKRGYFASGGHHPFDFLIENPATIANTVGSLDHVVAHAQRLNFFGLLGNARGELPIIAEGIEPESESRIGTSITMHAGRRLSGKDEFGVMVGEGLAKALKLGVGDRVDLVVSTREGAMNVLEFNVVGIFRTLSKEYDARAVRIPLRAAQELTATTGVSAIVVLLDSTDLTDRTRAALERSLPAGFEVRTWQQLADFYNSTAAFYQRQFAVLEIIILVMVLLSVANTVNMSLHERTPEFGIMRALGRTARGVFRLAVFEMVLLGAMGAALGIAIGVSLALLISAIGIQMPPPPNSESGFTAVIRIVPSIVAATFVLGIVASVCAALLPARKLARIPIVEALRRGV